LSIASFWRPYLSSCWVLYRSAWCPSTTNTLCQLLLWSWSCTLSKEVIIVIVCCQWSVIRQTFEASAVAVTGDYELMDAEIIMLL
jgi:hypothetical protein